MTDDNKDKPILENEANELNERLKTEVKGYHRESYRTFLTAPEWRNVDMAEEMAAFLKDGKPFYMYPYWSQIFTFWRIFFSSMRAAHKDTGWFTLIFSEYTLMNLFIGTTTTLECLAKGIVSLPFRLIGRRQNNTPFQQHCADVFTDYAAFLHHTPFYMYPYNAKIGPMWRAYWQSTPKTFADAITLLVTTAEFLVRSIPSLPIRWWYTQPANKEIEIINVMIERNDDTAVEQKLHDLEEKDPDIKLHERILARKQNNNTLYAHAEFARYDKFKKIIEDLSAINADATQNIKIKLIAGQEDIMVDFRTTKDKLAQAKEILGDRVLFTYDNSIDDNVVIAARIKSEELLDVVSKIKAADIELKLIHDF